jgi:hypothetical protein
VQDAYASCEIEHPGFKQPEQAVDPEVEAQLAEIAESALAFARCARDAGFARIADPDPETPTQIALGPDLTADDFRALLAACYDGDDARTLVGWDGLDELRFDPSSVLRDFLPADAYDTSGGLG